MSTTSHNINENIICLSLAAEDGYGNSKLQLRERSLLPITFENIQESGAYNIAHSSSLYSSGQNIISNQNSIVYFDHDTTEKLELCQTEPLQQVADAKTVAINWMSLRTREKLEESLMLVYSRLRNIEWIVITADHADYSPTSTSPLGVYAVSHDTILEYGQGPVDWCAVGREIQQTLRSQAFWRECNRRYALEQIVPIQMNPPRVPQVSIVRLAGGRGHDHDQDHEGDTGLPSQVPGLVRDLAPGLADIEILWESEQPEQPEQPDFADYTLQDLLD